MISMIFYDFFFIGIHDQGPRRRSDLGSALVVGCPVARPASVTERGRHFRYLLN